MFNVISYQGNANPVETTMMFHHTPTRRAKFKRITTPNRNKSVGKLEVACHALWVGTEVVQSVTKPFGSFFTS